MSKKRMLTPAEDLMMDVLAARYRLGEHIWPFRNDQKAIAKRLEAKGLVHLVSGQTENSFRAGLSVPGIELVVSPNYTPPLARDLVRSAAKRLRDLADELER